MAFLKTKDLRFSYRTGDSTVEILRGIDLEIERGEFVGFFGPSGSGKTTLFYLLGSMLRPTSGKIEFNGSDLARYSDEELARYRNRHIGYVFQQFHLLPKMTVLENILLPTQYPLASPSDPASARERATALAKRFGIDDKLEYLPSQLSGGQQQRVAIARAIMNDVDIIVADEPTGSLDGRSATEIVDLLLELNRAGKTIIFVSHDPTMKVHCDRVLTFHDGRISGEERRRDKGSVIGSTRSEIRADPKSTSEILRATLRLAFDNLRRRRGRSLMTSMGIMIGVAALVTVVTLGHFAQRRIVESYETLGANRLTIRAGKNWLLGARDQQHRVFAGFDEHNDVEPVRRIFPEVRLISMSVNTTAKVSAGGRSLPNLSYLGGVSRDYLEISNLRLAEGRNFTDIDVLEQRSVCIIGSEVARELFPGRSAIGEAVELFAVGHQYVCRVIARIAPVRTGGQMFPNTMVLIPHTGWSSIIGGRPWIWLLNLQIAPGHDVERVGRQIKNYFQNRYGNSANFDIGSDQVLVAQMKRFLNSLTLALAAVAVLILTVGGMGISNMIYASLAERLKEIGLRKAVGATDAEVRNQILMESGLLSAAGGIAGVIVGIFTSEGAIAVASMFLPSVRFEWGVDPVACLLAVAAIVAIGVLSGLAPAIRAARLQVVETLQSD